MGVRTNILDAKEKMQETTPAKTVSVTASTANNQSEPTEDGDKYKLSRYRKTKYKPSELIVMSNKQPGQIYQELIGSVKETGNSNDQFKQFGKENPNFTENLTSDQAVDRRISELQRVGAVGPAIDRRAAKRRIGINWNLGLGHIQDTDNIIDALDQLGVKNEQQAIAQIGEIVNADPYLKKEWNSEDYNRMNPNWKTNLASHYMQIKQERDAEMAKDASAKKPNYGSRLYYANPEYTAPYMTEAEKIQMKQSPEKYQKSIEPIKEETPGSKKVSTEEIKKKVGIGKKS